MNMAAADTQVEQGAGAIGWPERAVVCAERADAPMLHVIRGGKTEGDRLPPSIAVARQRVIGDDPGGDPDVDPDAAACRDDLSRAAPIPDDGIFPVIIREFADGSKDTDAPAVPVVGDRF